MREGADGASSSVSWRLLTTVAQLCHEEDEESRRESERRICVIVGCTFAFSGWLLARYAQSKKWGVNDREIIGQHYFSNSLVERGERRGERERRAGVSPASLLPRILREEPSGFAVQGAFRERS
jgi:hypothetical protein